MLELHQPSAASLRPWCEALELVLEVPTKGKPDKYLSILEGY